MAIPTYKLVVEILSWNVDSDFANWVFHKQDLSGSKILPNEHWYFSQIRNVSLKNTLVDLPISFLISHRFTRYMYNSFNYFII